MRFSFNKKVSKFRNVFLVSSILQKNERKIRPNYYGTSSRIVFVRFLEELKTPKDILKLTDL